MATAIAAHRHWTLTDLPELPDDGLTYDILGGELVVRNAPNTNHAVALIELVLFLGRAQDAGYGEVYTAVTAVALDFPARQMAAEYVPHPDLLFVRQERIGLRGWQAIEGVPDLVVEVLSPGTRTEHAAGGKLWDAYEQHGLPHYWLVDPGRRVIRQYTLQGEPHVGGHFGEPVTLRPGDTLTSPLFPDLSVPVERIFRRVRDQRRASP